MELSKTSILASIDRLVKYRLAASRIMESCSRLSSQTAILKNSHLPFKYTGVFTVFSLHIPADIALYDILYTNYVDISSGKVINIFIAAEILTAYLSKGTFTIKYRHNTYKYCRDYASRYLLPDGRD